MHKIPLISLGLAICLSPSVPAMADIPPQAASFAQRLGSLQNAMRAGQLTIAPVKTAGWDPTYPYFSQAFSQFSQQFSQFSNIPFCGYGGRC